MLSYYHSLKDKYVFIFTSGYYNQVIDANILRAYNKDLTSLLKIFDYNAIGTNYYQLVELFILNGFKLYSVSKEKELYYEINKYVDVLKDNLSVDSTIYQYYNYLNQGYKLALSSDKLTGDVINKYEKNIEGVLEKLEKSTNSVQYLKMNKLFINFKMNFGSMSINSIIILLQSLVDKFPLDIECKWILYKCYRILKEDLYCENILENIIVLQPDNYLAWIELANYKKDTKSQLECHLQVVKYCKYSKNSWKFISKNSENPKIVSLSEKQLKKNFIIEV
ncbi:hypothetical protein HANVADRAFT_51057 [Hanseniaspora valbyensis NRRL Y-1626]|uniref:Uncharacterized protein n=1 Tax=Hanseniaspora valbyensis NRRL Y-1626 TaxID=766949 RepID=A0A1B7TK90_9ASCO|nr:hypothetical protein HANVADRAFT_51057 [Hanseniaspora valbyensis NRRL Y-1626]